MTVMSGPLAWGAAGALPSVATLAGGAFAWRFRAALGLLLAFSSGAVIGVALFDLLPEAMRLASPTPAPLSVMTAVAGGFAFYLLVDSLSQLSSTAAAGGRSHLGPFSLSLHSLTDGLSIGFALHVSPAVAVVVAVAVIAHDVVDGANTVTLSLAAGMNARAARRWLLIDAAAPVLGIALAQLIRPSPVALGLLLATFGGLFLYVGASKLLPRSVADRTSIITSGAPVMGMVFIYAIVRAATV